ncbi:signal peptidase I [Candidatus Saganbacteria bacterium CG08_land_8_20_14_0_20_45_16]|uniref:Signal peptidase I n=1 Tax=Candidatus Saganbacteria bacterium CG08_land_8_20_14_0_20_45_16 TaxID=2014293 RepID=A0A2H0Y1S7_UNCSA|nr:MAG: signal peptidase I [Candidatus Saganbacteria bacterium CG08_land_8_20_14_0_20_45_16]
MSKQKISYLGPSMNPTLKVPDQLIVIPYRSQTEIKVGDVIVFKLSTKETNIVHRVIAISGQGIKTRGDNNNLADEPPLKFEEIIGQVFFAHRDSKQRRIWGGKVGQSYCHLIRAYRLVIKLLKTLGRSPYHLLAKTKLLGKIIPLQTWTKVVVFKNSKKLLWGKRLIGQLRNTGAKWQIYPPYHLFIDEKRIPC